MLLAMLQFNRQSELKDFDLFLSIFAFIFLVYFTFHKTVMNKYKSDVPYLQ
ncbi:hypothetical protein HG535_0F03630 [Zygotorulaspora mrakii]|uniref:Uncharacterized protein n=1 Tax=Zygotorulaspora mrakii TaxID=42260 RepID=A0A7H9B7Z7_ZYGMR|nr:uncharacterized protein HG535_0F03630 [Zygotorulaspora mrakii]QLG73852.1 hypothetical protein HG535_0F03630 [Zygotorulaspora mrakii]